MNSDGEIEDQARAPLDVTNEQVLTWYKNMMTVNILDSIMFEAQRQGRLSFYMVRTPHETLIRTLLNDLRYLPAKKPLW